MTITDTVTSLAHDAASAASGLGSQALEIGSKAADLGSDAASTVASAAGYLADSLGKKTGLRPQRQRHTMRWIVLFVLAGAGAFMLIKSKKRNSTAVDSGPIAQGGRDNQPMGSPTTVRA